MRQAIDGKVIVRTGRRIPGVRPVAGIHAPISVVRMAVGDAYGAKEWREGEGDDEVAFRTERIERRVCRDVAEYAFVHAAQDRCARSSAAPSTRSARSTRACSRKRWTRPPRRYPDVAYEPQLIDATYALLISTSGDPLVIPSLNRDGDCLSDLVMQLFGSIAGAESVLMSFDAALKPDVVMAEAPHGTAPRLFGKNVANPMAMILACGALLGHIDDRRAADASRAIYEGGARNGARGHTRPATSADTLRRPNSPTPSSPRLKPSSTSGPRLQLR